MSNGNEDENIDFLGQREQELFPFKNFQQERELVS